MIRNDKGRKCKMMKAIWNWLKKNHQADVERAAKVKSEKSERKAEKARQKEDAAQKHLDNLPEYRVVNVTGNRMYRKTIERNAALGYEVIDVSQGLAFGSNAGRTITFKLRD
jgi:uncharacterized transporter YbjL